MSSDEWMLRLTSLRRMPPATVLERIGAARRQRDDELQRVTRERDELRRQLDEAVAELEQMVDNLGRAL